MRYGPKTVTDKTGREIILRNAEPEDAPELLRYLKITAAETPFLVREPGEITLTEDQESEFICNKLASERELLLIASADGKHLGNCALMQIADLKRCRHRCGIAIALYQEACGKGIGRAMLNAVLDAAMDAGYQQAELEVIAENQNAIALYESLGFHIYGRMPDNIRYADGSFADAYWMMKKL